MEAVGAGIGLRGEAGVDWRLVVDVADAARNMRLCLLVLLLLLSTVRGGRRAVVGTGIAAGIVRCRCGGYGR